MLLPDYRGGSIVNLVSSLVGRYGAAPEGYAGLADAIPLAEARHIALLVIDGLGYEYLMSQSAASALRRYCCGRLTSVFPTTTASAITSLFTGLAPQQHAITGWFMHLKELGAVTAILPFRPRVGGQSFSHLNVDPSKIFDQRPVFDLLKRLDVASYIVTQRRIVNSDYSLAMNGRAERLAYADLSGYFEKLRATLLGHGGLGVGGRKYVYAYWPDLDLLAHQYGIESEQVRHHFEEIDQGFAAFLEAIHGSDTLVIAIADHGFIDSPPERLIQLKDHPPLAETLALPLCGEPRAAYCYVRPGKTRQFESYVSRELCACCELHRSEDLVAQGYFGLGTPSPRLLDRIGDYALIMKENYVLKDFLLGEGKHLQIGVHGGLSPQELYVPLIAVQA